MTRAEVRVGVTCVIAWLHALLSGTTVRGRICVRGASVTYHGGRDARFERFTMSTPGTSRREVPGHLASLLDSETHGLRGYHHLDQPELPTAWVWYDLALWRQAALTGLTQWLAMNPTLYILCFAGSAWTANQCKLCFAATHTTKECTQLGDHNRLRTIEWAVLSMTSRPRPPPTPQPPGNGTAGGTFWRGVPQLECEPVHIPLLPPLLRMQLVWAGGGHPTSYCTLKPSQQPL